MSNKEKVFCIGLSRTGTTSLCAALEELGYKTVHFSLGLFLNPQVIQPGLSFTPRQKLNWYWKRRLNSEIRYQNNIFPINFFDKYDAFGDLPIPLYYKQLNELYPNAKFIYTYRDEENWLRSMEWLYGDGAVMWKHGLLDDEIKFSMYKSFKYDREKLIQSYRQHHKEVLHYFKDKENKCLVINIDETNLNFELLGKFLNVQWEEKTFPHVNSGLHQTYLKRADYWLGKEWVIYSLVKVILSKLF